MTPTEAEEVRLAARLLAAYFQEDLYEIVELVEEFEESSIQHATDGLIRLSRACAEVIAKSTSEDAQRVFDTLPHIKCEIIPEIVENRVEIIRLVRCLWDDEPLIPHDIDVPTAFVSAFNVSASLTNRLSEITGLDCEYLASTLSESAEREM